MTTLSDKVTNDIDSVSLISATNPRKGSFTTINADTLVVACDYVEDEFADFVGAFDETDSRHLNIAVQGVMARLFYLADPASQAANDAIEVFQGRLKRLRATTHQDWVAPVTSDEVSRMPRTAGRWVIPRQPR